MSAATCCFGFFHKAIPALPVKNGDLIGVITKTRTGIIQGIEHDEVCVLCF